MQDMVIAHRLHCLVSPEQEARAQGTVGEWKRRRTAKASTGTAGKELRSPYYLPLISPNVRSTEYILWIPIAHMVRDPPVMVAAG